MPTPATNKRVKGKRITRPFVIGTEAWKLNDSNRPPKIKPGDTTGWRVYVRPVPGGPALTAWLKKVVFVLHETFPNPVRTIENPTPTSSFELEETGYGGFYIGIKLYFQSYTSEKWQQRQHFLQLDPYGDEALMAEQARTGLVRSEVVEYIEFNEPTELLWDALTSEAQWEYLDKERAGAGRGKGKGKGKSKVVPSGEERTVELPDTALPGSIYSKETEEKLIDVLTRAGKQCDEQTLTVLQRSKELSDLLEKMKEVQTLDDKLREVYESIPPKKK
ncbi:putative histone acetyltransferase subunit [Trichodelitschia bisporula]|uniref:Protein AF-9 homolog n=1 Tax=Trichodelitschia bisporula TaxID=703511 RepID=A0A6G1HPU5_9PEZI|nr:putative histone acetyltransferase subunit [Trichodelitschia bisporula]